MKIGYYHPHWMFKMRIPPIPMPRWLLDLIPPWLDHLDWPPQLLNRIFVKHRRQPLEIPLDCCGPLVTPSNPTDAQGVSDGETRDQLTHGELRRWLAGRKDAGRLIDIETCEILKTGACDDDPYGIREMLGENPYDQRGSNLFLRSPDSDGWIWEGHLPSEKHEALYARLKREANTYENYLQWARDSKATFHAKEYFWRIRGTTPASYNGALRKEIEPRLRTSLKICAIGFVNSGSCIRIFLITAIETPPFAQSSS